MTRTMWTLAFLFLALALPSRAADHGRIDPHVRSEEREILETLAHGVSVSPSLHALVDRLDVSDVVVYLGFDRSPSPRLAGHLTLIAAVPGRRYLRVAIDRRLNGLQRVGILGHELQHAVEIAESPWVTDETSLSTLYRRIGFRSDGATGECFESVGAIFAGRSVEKEMRKRYTEFTRGSR